MLLISGVVFILDICMGREILPSVKGVFVMGSLAGSTVGPGIYTLRMNLDGSSVEQKVEVLADPRLEATPEDFVQQQEMLVSMESAIREMHQSVSDLRKVKSQLNTRLELLSALEGSEEIQKKGKEVLESIEIWEEQLIQPRQKTFQDVINFENRLNAELNNLRGLVDSYDPRPTQGARERLDELLGQWNQWDQEMKRIIQTEVGAFNALYSEMNYPALIVPGRE